MGERGFLADTLSTRGASAIKDIGFTEFVGSISCDLTVVRREIERAFGAAFRVTVMRQERDSLICIIASETQHMCVASTRPGEWTVLAKTV